MSVSPAKKDKGAAGKNGDSKGTEEIKGAAEGNGIDTGPIDNRGSDNYGADNIKVLKGLDAVRKRLDQASSSVEDAQKKTRTLAGKLRAVEALPEDSGTIEIANPDQN